MGLLSDIFQSMFHPEELVCLARLKYQQSSQSLTKDQPLVEFLNVSPQEFCYAALSCVSRSFAFVIQILPAEIRDAICVFYLVLRALDTVEDDMEYEYALRSSLLIQFHEKLSLQDFKVMGVGSKDERTLLENFSKVLSMYHSLNVKYQSVIYNITKQMGAGMQEFALKHRVCSLEEWDLYCFYVAGIVGHGLSALFAASGLEDESLAQEHKLAKSMGLFLQKTNIIRDYLEDLEEGRIFWPEEIWKEYAPELSWYREFPDSHNANLCLNHLIFNALQHVPDCIDYMSKIKNPEVFRFCGIPQVMAIATLALLFNNQDVFKKRGVKIRKGITARVIVGCTDFDAFKKFFNEFSFDILKNLDSAQVHNKSLFQEKLWELQALSKVESIEKSKNNSYFVHVALISVIVLAILFHL